MDKEREIKKRVADAYNYAGMIAEALELGDTLSARSCLMTVRHNLFDLVRLTKDIPIETDN